MCCLLFAVLAILLTFCWEGEAPTEPKCRVDAVFYRPDRGTPFQWFESAKEIQAFHAEHYRAAGTVEIYLQNRSEKSTAVSRLIVNGQDVTNPQKGGMSFGGGCKPTLYRRNLSASCSLGFAMRHKSLSPLKCNSTMVKHCN